MGSVRDTALVARHAGGEYVPAVERRIAVSADDNAKNETDISDEDLEKAQNEASEVEKRYVPGARPTVVVEGTDGTVAGTAFASDDDIEKYQDHNADEEQS